MQNSNNVQSNLEKLAEILKSKPAATHIYMRRLGDDNMVVDVPIEKHAEFTIRNNPKWEVVSSNKDMDDEVEKLFSEPDLPQDPALEVPPKPSEKKRGRPPKAKP